MFCVSLQKSSCRGSTVLKGGKSELYGLVLVQLLFFIVHAIPGGYSGFQVTRIIEEIFWVETFGKYFFGWLDLSSPFFLRFP